MFKNKVSWKQIILGMIIFLILGYLSWLVIPFFIYSLIKADAKIAAAIIGGMFTVFAGLAAVIITQKQTKLREIEEAHREKKIEIYNRFITLATSMMATYNDKVDIKAPSEKELITTMFNFKKEILLWGSPMVIKAHLEMERASNKNPEIILVAMNNIYKAMRKDIGLSNSGLNENELIKLFLSNPEEIDI